MSEWTLMMWIVAFEGVVVGVVVEMAALEWFLLGLLVVVVAGLGGLEATVVREYVVVPPS
jgi:hypothetical protein